MSAAPLSRRGLLAGAAVASWGLAAGAVDLGAGQGAGDAALEALLDDLAGPSAGAPAAARLARLSRFDPAALSDRARTDYDIIRAGLGREAAAGPHDYAAALALQFGAGRDPLLAHRLALAEARTVQAEADRLLRSQGLTRGPLDERLRALARDPRWLLADDDAGRDRAVAQMNAWLAKARARLPAAFARIPAAVDRVSVRRMSAADEVSARAGYREIPAFDGSTPGAYRVDLHDIRARPAWSLPSVVHHELLPGHMVQIPLEGLARPHRLRERYAAAFQEGWAIYAEQLADEEGAFAADPLARIGYLQWRLFRLGRVIVDTGLHALGWDAARAKSFLTALQGDPMVFAPFDADIARMQAQPGASAAQGLMALEIASQKRRARAVMGEDFDTRFFHDAVLAKGPLPADGLEAEVAAYIARPAGAAVRLHEPRSRRG